MSNLKYLAVYIALKQRSFFSRAIQLFFTVLLSVLILCSFSTTKKDMFTNKELYIIHSSLCKYSVYIKEQNQKNQKTRISQTDCDSLIIKVHKIIH